MYAHDGSLVDGGDLSSAVLLCVVEGVSGNSLGGLVGNQLNRLNDAVDDLPSAPTHLTLRFSTHLVLDTGVLSLSVFTDKNLQVSNDPL